MHGEEISNTLLVEVAGTLLPADVAAMLTSGYVDDSVNVPDLFVLRFSDDGGRALTKGGFRIGVKVRVLVQASGPGVPVPLVSGEVTALETELGADGVHSVVRGLDHSHRLFRGRRVEAYVQMTASEVAAKVATRAGLKKGKMDSGGPVLEHVGQDGINDWDFLRRLADEVGAEVTVTDGALDFRTPTDAAKAPSGQAGSREDPLVIERGANLVSLRATVTSADQVPEVEVRGWDVEGKRPFVAVAPAATRSAKLDGIDPATLGKTFGSPSWPEPVSRYGNQQQCTFAAKAVAERLAGSFAELDGVIRGNPVVHAGTAIALTNLGESFDGRYTLSATRHEFTPEQGYLTSFTVSNVSERSLYGVAAGGTGGLDRMSGVLTATVSDIKDPQARGRVKLAFPVLSDRYVSGWVRTVQPGAGASRGAVVLPEVGDEVLVAFGMGSIQEPYVLGGLYNGVDKPTPGWAEHVGSTDGSVQRRAFCSRTGMVVEMIEKPQEEKLTLSTNGGAQRVTLTQKRDAAIEIIAEGPVTVTGKKDVAVSSTTGDVTVKGKKVTIEATSDLQLTGVNVSVKATAGAGLEGATVKVAGSATAEVSGGATTTVKGGIVRIN
ncbi:MAG TPA: VgrG-related protein [Mycobacteriales bacterium]